LNRTRNSDLDGMLVQAESEDIHSCFRKRVYEGARAAVVVRFSGRTCCLQCSLLMFLPSQSLFLTSSLSSFWYVDPCTKTMHRRSFLHFSSSLLTHSPHVGIILPRSCASALEEALQQAACKPQLGPCSSLSTSHFNQPLSPIASVLPAHIGR